VWRPLVRDTQLEFRLADVTRTRTDREYFSDEDDVKLKFTSEGGHDVIDPERNLNIWVCNLQHVAMRMGRMATWSDESLLRRPP
jgi:hypothetical protein